ncbi:hypothetical protein [uncultured Helicobacter sp.]|nr:hypothetical protein [uncultured Helicobacter sp.]
MTKPLNIQNHFHTESMQNLRISCGFYIKSTQNPKSTKEMASWIEN